MWALLVSVGLCTGAPGTATSSSGPQLSWDYVGGQLPGSNLVRVQTGYSTWLAAGIEFPLLRDLALEVEGGLDSGHSMVANTSQDFGVHFLARVRMPIVLPLDPSWSAAIGGGLGFRLDDGLDGASFLFPIRARILNRLQPKLLIGVGTELRFRLLIPERGNAGWVVPWLITALTEYHLTPSLGFFAELGGGVSLGEFTGGSFRLIGGAALRL